jgi:hypothetical protein
MGRAEVAVAVAIRLDRTGGHDGVTGPKEEG